MNEGVLELRVKMCFEIRILCFGTYENDNDMFRHDFKCFGQVFSFKVPSFNTLAKGIAP